MYRLKINPELQADLKKLVKKNRKQYEMIINKTEEILENPHRYKNLRVPMNHLKRVHIDNHFVLVFLIDENSKVVTLEDFDHHDLIYK